MIGIDISKHTLSATLLDPKTRLTLWQIIVPNNQEGYQQIFSRAPKHVPCVVEPTGCYSLPVVKAARKSGREVLLAPPQQAKQFLSAVSPRAKTDPLDSRGLALFAMATPLSPYPDKSEAVETLEQLLSARRGISLSLSSLSLQKQSLPHAREVLQQAITDLSARIKELDEQIALLTAQKESFPVVEQLQAVPGIGKVVAATVASRLVSRNFASPGEFVAFVGLDLKVEDSGKRQGRKRLTKRGDAELRRLLYLAAQASLRAKNSPFKAQFERERQKGLSKTAAVCVVARKMARLCWSLWRHGSSYDPERVYRQPN